VSGPEHYREAERLLAEARVPARDRAKPGWLTAAERYAMAQVHATLALAAATAEPIVTGFAGDEDTAIAAAWAEAVS
jgi:hypothetical protein